MSASWTVADSKQYDVFVNLQGFRYWCLRLMHWLKNPFKTITPTALQPRNALRHNLPIELKFQSQQVIQRGFGTEFALVYKNPREILSSS